MSVGEKEMIGSNGTPLRSKKRVAMIASIAIIVILGLAMLAPATLDQNASAKHFKRISQTITQESVQHAALGHESHQQVELLKLLDEVIYRGAFTYTSSKAVDIFVYHELKGEAKGIATVNIDGKEYAFNKIFSGQGGTVRFVGNGLIAHSPDSEKYTVTVSIDAFARSTTGPLPELVKKVEQGGFLKLSRANIAETVPLVEGYYGGEQIFFIHTEISNKDSSDKMTKNMRYPVKYTPLLAQTPESALAKVYLFTNGIEYTPPAGAVPTPFGFQPDVLDSVPADPNYSPLRVPHLVTWKEGATPRLLKSEAEILQAEANGEVTIKKTGSVVNLYAITWPGGQFKVRNDARITEDMPYSGGQVLEIDTNKFKVIFVAHRGWGPDGTTQYKIKKHETDKNVYEEIGVPYAPRIVNLLKSQVTSDLFHFTNGMKSSGPFGFQPVIASARPGDENYSPISKIQLVKWNDPSRASVLAALPDIDSSKDKLSIAPLGEGLVLNTPFIVTKAPTAKGDFSLNAKPSSVTVPQFHAAPEIRITVTSLNGFSGDVSLSVINKPDTLYTIFEEKVLTLAPDSQTTTTLTITDADGLTQVGKYKLTLQASSGDLSHTQTIDVEVVPMAMGGMPHG